MRISATLVGEGDPAGRLRPTAPGAVIPASVDGHERHVRRLVPPRPAGARPADVPRRPRGRDDRARAVRAGPRPARPGGGGPAHLPLPVAAGARRALGGRLLVVRGDPAEVVPRVAAAVDAATVHVAADFGPYGATRDEAVAKALAEDGRELVRTGSPYAVAPGRVRKDDGDAVQGLHPVPPSVGRARLAQARRHRRGHPRVAEAGRRGGGRSPTTSRVDAELPEAGEDAAHARWQEFLDGAIADYAPDRDRPDKPGTSRMSVHLKYGEIHPRTMLADIARRRSDVGRDLPHRDRLAGVLRRRPPPAARLRPPELRPLVRRAAGGVRRRPRAGVRGVARGPHRLPDRRRRDAPAARRGVDAQPGADDRGELPRQGPAPAVVVGRPALHAAASSTATWPPTSTAGSGRRAAAPTRRRTSACSTRSRRGRSSTRTATTCAASSPSCAAFAGKRCTSRGSCPTACRRATRSRSSTTGRARGGAGAVRAGQGRAPTLRGRWAAMGPTLGPWRRRGRRAVGVVGSCSRC